MSFSELQSIFESIYHDDRWTNGSGPGSLPKHTIEYRAFLSKFLVENNITTVTDLGCGDWQSTRLLDWSGISYIGLDVVPSLVERNAAMFGASNITFRHMTSLEDLPGGDLCLCKEVLQHLPNADVEAHIDAISQRYRFGLITNCVEPQVEINCDIAAGGVRPLRLDLEPFNFKGCNVFTYNPQSGSWIFKNHVFLLFGQG